MYPAVTVKNAQASSELLILGRGDALAMDICTWAGGDSVKVWFFSVDYLLFRQLSVQWRAQAQFAPVGEMLNEVALRYKDAFVNVDQALLAVNGADVGWFASDIVERSPYASTFLLSACRVIILQRGLAAGGKHIVVVDDLDFGLALYRTARALGVQAWWRKCGALPRRFVGLIERVRVAKAGLKARARGGVGTLLRIHKLSDVRKRHSIKLRELRSADILMVVWARHDTFPTDVVIREAPFLGPLPTVLNEHGYKIAYLVLPLSSLDAYSMTVGNVLRVKDPMLILEDTLSFFSVMAVGWRSLFQGRAIGKTIKIAGHDLSAVVAYEKAREWRSWRPGGARLFEHVGRYLKRQGIEPKAVLHLYENHSWEKCLAAGLRTYLPGTRVLGCQQSPFSPLYLNFIPSRRDVRSGDVPDALLVSGPRFQREIEASSYPSAQIFTVGSFRYRAFLEQRQSRAVQDVHRMTKQILCATGPDELDCIELVSKVVDAASTFPSVRVVVNFHPLTDDGFRNAVKLATVTKDSESLLNFTPLGIQDLLDTVDCVCYSDTNSVFEAMSRGVPVVHVQRVSALDYDKAPAGASASARSVQELSQLIDRLVRGEQIGPTGEQVDDVIKDSLGPVDRDAILRAVLTLPLNG